MIHYYIDIWGVLTNELGYLYDQSNLTQRSDNQNFYNYGATSSVLTSTYTDYLKLGIL